MKTKIEVFCDSLKLLEIDKNNIGTDNYLGLAYFWHYDYRYPMRDVDCETRVLIHDAMLESNLALGDASKDHEAIINRITALTGTKRD